MSTLEPGRSFLNLENKIRQQSKIAHEQGAGSQCARCGPKCSGFDLHYWRKICRNCRCGKENHNVEDDENPSNRVERLLCSPTAGHLEKRTPDSGLESSLAMDAGVPTSPLDWIPPAVDAHLAVKYMEQLPVSQQPITGSQAAVDRKRALERQLPSHDFEPDQCQSLLPNEKPKMEDYVRNMRQFVVGQGVLQECPPRRAGKLPPPPPKLNAIVVEKVNHLAGQDNRQPGAGLPPTKRIPQPVSQCMEPKPYVKAPQHKSKPLPVRADYVETDLTDLANLPPPPPDMLVDLPAGPASTRKPMAPEPETGIELIASECSKPRDPVHDFFDFLDEQEGKKLPGRLQSPFLNQDRASGNVNPTAIQPQAQRWTSHSTDTSSLRQATDASHPVTGNKGSPKLAGRNSPISSGNGPRRLLTADFNATAVHQDNYAIGKNSHSVIEAPASGRGQSTSSASSLLQQQQQSNQHSHRESEPFSDQQASVIAQQQQELIQDTEKPWICRQCAQPIESGTVAIFAERAGSDKCWHPQCFVCSICGERLADLVYFYVDNNVFCGRHYAEKMNVPRCKACDELIFSSEYTSADQAYWHINHFCCWLCDTPLAGQTYTPVKGQPHCLDCYQKKYGKNCYECKKPIRADESRVSHGDMHWHNSPTCFRCRTCNTSMMNRQFILKDQQIYCSKDCFIQHVHPQRTQSY